jgi:pSer/pThr/pTyr-binding forkhead associated (FHA) protein
VDWASDDVDVTRRAAPSRPTVRFTWDDGTVTSMTLPTLLGRNPAATAADLAVAIADTTLSLSKTHARVTVSPPAIEDLDSTNGVGIERNGNYVSVPRRQLTNLAAGDVVVLGNRRASVEVVS